MEIAETTRDLEVKNGGIAEIVVFLAEVERGNVGMPFDAS